MSLSAYSKTTWVNGGTPAINQTNLNKIETGIDDVTDDILIASTIGDATVTQEITSLASTVLEAPFSTAYLRARTVDNILGTAGDFEATTGWSGTNATIATDTNHEIFTSNALKITLTDVAGTVDFDVFSRLKTDSYYFLSAYIKNGNATNINLEFETDDADVVTADVTATTYNRVGLVVQPSDFNAASTALFRFNVTGAGTQYAYVEGAMMVEITSAEYALGATALLTKYPWHNDIKGSDKIRVLSVGKNLVRNGNLEEGTSIWTPYNANVTISYTGSKFRIKSSGSSYGAYNSFKVAKNTDYYLSGNITNGTQNGNLAVYNETFTAQLKNGAGTFNTSTNDIINVYIYPSDTGYADFDSIMLSPGTTAPSYESYKSTSAIVDTVGNSVSDTIYDKIDLLTGEHTKNVSDVVTLSGNAYPSCTMQGDGTGFKVFGLGTLYGVAGNATGLLNIYKYNNKTLTNVGGSGSLSGGDQVGNSGSDTIIAVSDTDTGWDESWGGGTSFTGLTWGGLIGAYLNGWKLTTADVDVANCEWTGIASGTTKTGAGAGGYDHVVANIDAGFQPYRMYYQLAEPIVTNYYPNVLESYPSGTIIIEPCIEDKGIYGTNLAITDTALPISSLVEVWKVNTDDTKTPIAISDCTVAAGGLTYTISGASANEHYKYIYKYVGLSSTPSLVYDTADSTRAVEDNLCTAVANLDEKIEDVETAIDADIAGIRTKLERYGASSGGSDTYAVTNTYPTKALYTGLVQHWTADVANTGASTLNVDGHGAKANKVYGSGGKVDTTTGDIIAGGKYVSIYDGTDMILLNPNALLQSVVTAQGDILYASATNTITRLAKGTANQKLRMNSGATIPEWVTDTFITYNSYAGDDSATRNIALGISATFVILHDATTDKTFVTFGTTGLGIPFDNYGTGLTEALPYISGTNLVVGTSGSNTNASGRTYQYWAIG